MATSPTKAEAAILCNIRGRVQGVGFRWFVRDAAARLGLRGYVKNLADGTVELVAVGPREALDSLVATCREGPAGSRVEAVDVQPAPTTSTYTAFEIAR